MPTERTPIEHAPQSFVREHDIRFLQRALRTEADPDDRRVIRRLLREQERVSAAADAQDQRCTARSVG